MRSFSDRSPRCQHILQPRICQEQKKTILPVCFILSISAFSHTFNFVWVDFHAVTDSEHKNTNQAFEIAWIELAIINQFARRSSPMHYDKSIYLMGAACSDAAAASSIRNAKLTSL